jgi:hypothetical protein
MKTSSLFVAGLAVAILSITPANAEKNRKNEDSYKCSTTTFPVLSAVQCNKPVAKSYVECVEITTQKGWRGSDAWWGCSSQGFKN